MSTVLILGSGGREHAIAASIAMDKKVEKIFCAPGNPGTNQIAENISIDLNDNNIILNIIEKNKIDFTIVGPEGPLENGVVDFIGSHGYKIFGPDKYGAQLETSKLFARDFMEKYNIPQPSYFRCSSDEEVISVSSKLGFPIVLKADGLAAGKGVIICNNQSEMEEAMDIMFKEKKFGNASKNISVEECLKGEEVSIFIVSDGENYKILNSAQDHKRIYDNDQGPNTGGMGAYCPSPLVNRSLMKKIEDTIIRPTIKGMKNDGHPYMGFLYIGLMISDNNPYVIEFNVRMGDPETQVVIPLLKTPLYDLLISAINQKLDNYKIEISDEYAVCVVLASKGYPKVYTKGKTIEGLDLVKDDFIFHAGTKYCNDAFITNGGRVLNIIGFGKSLKSAIEKAYSNVKKIRFSGKYCRNDIGKKGLSYERSLERES